MPQPQEPDFTINWILVGKLIQTVFFSSTNFHYLNKVATLETLKFRLEKIFMHQNWIWINDLILCQSNHWTIKFSIFSRCIFCSTWFCTTLWPITSITTQCKHIRSVNRNCFQTTKMLNCSMSIWLYKLIKHGRYFDVSGYVVVTEIKSQLRHNVLKEKKDEWV